MNFFSWIRDGVRQAVLLGVSDAVQELGSPHEGDEMPRRLLEVIRNSRPALTAETFDSGPKRKKLGRTLEEIQASAAGKTHT
jgi:hypothetical protein